MQYWVLSEINQESIRGGRHPLKKSKTIYLRWRTYTDRQKIMQMKYDMNEWMNVCAPFQTISTVMRDCVTEPDVVCLYRERGKKSSIFKVKRYLWPFSNDDRGISFVWEQKVEKLSSDIEYDCLPWHEFENSRVCLSMSPFCWQRKTDREISEATHPLFRKW